MTRGILNGLSERGDIFRTAGGGFAALPPVAVQALSESKQSSFFLIGNTLLDSAVATALRASKGRLEYSQPEPRFHGEIVLFERVVHATTGGSDQNQAVLQDEGFLVLSHEELRSALPETSSLMVPPTSQFRSISLPKGLWQERTQGESGNPQWMPVESLIHARGDLLRWREGDDWQEGHFTRYFLSGGSCKLFEIRPSTAFMWLLRVDTELGHPRSIHIGNEHLRIPLPIPQVYIHWLRTMGHFAVVGRAGLASFCAESDRLQDVARTLVSRLGFLVQDEGGGST
jgi:hypothetical protein